MNPMPASNETAHAMRKMAEGAAGGITWEGNADDAEIHALARGWLGRLAEAGRGNDERRGGDGGLAEKMPARGSEIVRHGGIPVNGAVHP